MKNIDSCTNNIECLSVITDNCGISISYESIYSYMLYILTFVDVKLTTVISNTCVFVELYYKYCIVRF